VSSSQSKALPTIPTAATVDDTFILLCSSLCFVLTIQKASLLVVQQFSSPSSG
jgi:hypothetical protein